MQKALVIGASGGVGGALKLDLESRGYAVTGISRTDNGLDITDPQSVATTLAPLRAEFDLIVLATGTLSASAGGPEKSLAAIDADAMLQTLAVNTVGTALILQHVPRLLPKDRRAVVAVLTARVGSIGDNHLGGWYSYRASKAAANQIVRTASIEIARSHKFAVVTALHPGTVDTPFTANYPAHKKISAATSARALIDVIENLRVEDTGGFYDWKGARIPW